jgi:DNA repair protein RecO (recombination protein O)
LTVEITTPAVILRRFDTGESDQVVWLLTEQRGRLSAFAPGARRSKRRFAGGIEPYALVQASLASPRRGELWRLTELSPQQTLPGLRASLEAIACAGFACELCAELARDSDPAAALYELLATYLRALDAGQRGAPELFGFLFEALEAAGLQPQLACCARCGGAPLAPETFDPTEGGRLCARCPPRGPGAIRARGEALDALAAIQAGQLVELGREPRALAWRYLEHQLSKRLQSHAMLEELGLA